MNWILGNLDLIGSLSWVHVRHSLIPLAIGFAVSIPLGWLAWRLKALRSPIVVTTGLLYTIPSLALLTMLPAALGVAPYVEINLILALTLYAVALLVRTVVDGLASVDDDVRLAATAMGYGRFKRVWRGGLPPPGPVILPGLRGAAAAPGALAAAGGPVGGARPGHLLPHGPP